MEKEIRDYLRDREHLDEYIDYLSRRLSDDSKKDFQGNDWINKQKIYVLSRKWRDVSCLFRKLFIGGLCYEKVFPHKQYSFIDGVNQILQLVRKQYKSDYENNRDNRRFFTSRYPNDFEGIWAELILLEGLNEYGFEVLPADKPSELKYKSHDLDVMRKQRRYSVQVKCFTDAKFYNSSMSTFGSSQLTRNEIKNILRNHRKAIKGFHSSIIVVIDISLYYELFSDIAIRIFSDIRPINEIFHKALTQINGNRGNVYPLLFQLRTSETQLLSRLCPTTWQFDY